MQKESKQNNEMKKGKHGDRQEPLANRLVSNFTV